MMYIIITLLILITYVFGGVLYLFWDLKKQEKYFKTKQKEWDKINGR